MRVGTLRHSPGEIFHEAAERVAVGSLQRVTQCYCPASPACGLSECTMSARVSQQGERLVVKIEARVLDTAVETHHRDNGAIGGDKMLAEIVERVLRRCTPWAVPAETTGLAVRESLTRKRSRSVRLRYGIAIEVDRLVEASADMIGPDIPPERQRRLEQPATQRRGLAHNLAQVGGPGAEPQKPLFGAAGIVRLI